MENNTINNKKHEQTRKKLKVIGITFLTIGGIFFLVGIISFFIAFNTGGVPKLFWCCFIGIIFIGIGASCAKLGFMKQVGGYVASQTVPIAKDSINYLAKNTKDSLADSAATIKNSINSDQIKCNNCGTLNKSTAKYCDNCGKPLAKICPKCNALNDTKATYCDNCGTHL